MSLLCLLCWFTFNNGSLMYFLSCSASQNSQTGEEVAIKKIANAFGNQIDAKRTLREIKLLRHLDHPNVRISTSSITAHYSFFSFKKFS